VNDVLVRVIFMCFAF